jgi:competence protein ComEC
MHGLHLRKKIHISWMIAALCLGVVIGVISVQYVSASLFYSYAWLMLGIALTAVASWRSYFIFIPVVISAGVFIGLWRGSVDQVKLTIYERLVGQTLTIKGKVGEDVDLNSRSESVVRLHSLGIGNHTLPGSMYVTTKSKADIKRGDEMELQGKLADGFGTFPAVMYQARVIKVQRPEPGDIARQVRDWFADAIRAAIPDPQASLGIGYLVGQRRALPPELDDALRIAGLTHIVVASGYNLTILVRFARRSFEKVSKYLSALSAGTMIVSFVAITGLSPSMSRAGLVAGLSLLAWYYGRKFHPIVLLLFAAAITLLVNPSLGWTDLGWQLSFAAFAGVMIVAPLAQRYFFGDKKPGTIRQILGETTAAQLVTFPILVLAFGQFSNVAILANILVLPLVPLAMLLTFIAGIGAIILPGLATAIGIPASWLLEYMTKVAEYLASLSWAQTDLTISWWHVAVMYSIITAACLYMWRKTNFNLRDSNLVE